MNLKATIRPFDWAICLVLLLVALAEPCFGQTDQAPTSPRTVPTPPPPVTGDANIGTSRAGNEGDTSASAIDDSTRTTKVDKGRKLVEEMVVIDAATRKKQREREMANHDKTFDSSILDVGVDSVVIGKSSSKRETKPAPILIPTPGPAAKSSATPAPVSALQPEPGTNTSLSLEIVPVVKSQQPSPAPSATASPPD